MKRRQMTKALRNPEEYLRRKWRRRPNDNGVKPERDAVSGVIFDIFEPVITDDGGDKH